MLIFTFPDEDRFSRPGPPDPRLPPTPVEVAGIVAIAVSATFLLALLGIALGIRW